ncbi:SDR family oxidoreductase [Myxococcota bacterium]|nr:SDR family oxidoreductase [Myxococcota bacterium]
MTHSQGRLAGKVAIVTGAGSSGPGVGTGKAMSILFAREGARVVLVDRDPEAAEATLADLQTEAGQGLVVQADVTRSEDCQRAAEAAMGEFGGLDILVNNVGVASGASAVEVTEEEWGNVLDVNLKSMMLMCKHTIPRMSAGGGGSIINLSSIAGLRSASPGGSVAYSASKGGVVALTTDMAAAHGRENIRINCIAPGQLHTPMVAGLLTDEFRELRAQSAPLGTEGTAWDVAWAAVFLASEESRWITGVVLPVDAGVVTTTPLAMLPHLR